MELSRSAFSAGRVLQHPRIFVSYAKDMQMSTQMSMQMRHLLFAQGPQFLMKIMWITVPCDFLLERIETEIDE
jgi:hypothetical protein